MIIHRWGLVPYEEAGKRMKKVHQEAQEQRNDHLILCSHPKIFTVGANETRDFGVETIQADRGGSITAHAPGQNIYYFCFQAPKPAHFYKKVLLSFTRFFQAVLPQTTYDKANPGFYVGKGKIASIGFRYANGVSLHGVSLNVDCDLAFCNQVPPCGLKGYKATSLAKEGCDLCPNAVDTFMIKTIQEVFDV